MTPEQIQQIIDLLTSLGTAAAAKGWELAMRQVYVNLALNLFWLGLSIVALCAIRPIYRAGLRSQEKHNANRGRFASDWQWGLDGVGYSLAILGAGSFGVLGFVITATGAIGLIVNPEWAAVKILAGLVGGG